MPYIRGETSADLPAIEAVTACAFVNAPYSTRTEQHIVDALRRAGALTISLVAEAGGTLIGHAPGTGTAEPPLSHGIGGSFHRFGSPVWEKGAGYDGPISVGIYESKPRA